MVLNFIKFPIIFFVITTSIGVFLFNNNLYNTEHFNMQAESFINGKLDIPLSMDTACYQGKCYWPQGPFPSLLLIPYILIFGKGISQQFFHLFLLIPICIIVYQLSKKFLINKEKTFFLTYAFLFSSNIITLIPNTGSVIYAQVVTVLLSITLLWEYFTLRRFFILGIICSAIIATRPTAALLGILVLFPLFTEKITPSQKIKKLSFFLVPIITTIFILLWFNYARFGNPLVNGYGFNDVGSEIKILRDHYGTFSVWHIPSNIYYYYLISVQPVTDGTAHLVFPFITYSYWGLSVFVVSPFFLYSVFTLKKGTPEQKILWVIVFITMLILLMYYATGWTQFGSRYIADLFPAVYVLTLQYFQKNQLNNTHKIIILLSSFINAYLLLSKVYLYYAGIA